MILAFSLQIHESRQLLKSLQTLGGAQMTYFEVLIESFEDITENGLPNRASWEHRWCGLLPWAAAACQGHSKMVMSSSLALPLPVPGEIRFAAGARAGIRGSVCRLGPAAFSGHCPCLVSSFLTAWAACHELYRGLRACLSLVNMDKLWWLFQILKDLYTLCEQE